MEFATFCNICFNKESLRNIEKTEHLTRILMMFIGNKIVIEGQDMYLCLSCCAKLESYDQFKQMCLRNFVDFRIEFYKLKKKLEMMNDQNIGNKLRNFIETKVYGDRDTLNLDLSEHTSKAEYNIYTEESQKNLTEKQNEENYYNHNIHSVSFKTEKMECTANEEDQFHTELDLKNSEDDIKLPVPDNFIKVESYVEEGKQCVMNDYNYGFESVNCKAEKIECEDNEEYKLHYELHLENSEDDLKLSAPDERTEVESYVVAETCTTESSSKNKPMEESKCKGPYKMDKECDITTKLTQHADRVSLKALNKNAQSNNKEISVLECNTYRETFDKANNLNIHVQNNSDKKQYTCTICNKSFNKPSGLKTHEAVHTGEKRYTCKVCNKTFAQLSHLKVHGWIHTGEKRYSCKVCNKTFTTRSQLKDHEWVHTGERPHLCNICNKGFYRSNRLKKHMLTHTDGKPYTCLICNKSFKKAVNLKEHESVHTGEKPYACTMCNKTFSNSGYLKFHALTHTGEKPFSCEVCQKSFLHMKYLKQHERLHSGEKPYECTLCNKRFYHRSACDRHKLAHTGEKPYPCSVCNKAFTQLSTLKEHEVAHTGIKPYSCDICKKRFRRKGELRSHTQKPCVLNVVEEKIIQQTEET